MELLKKSKNYIGKIANFVFGFIVIFLIYYLCLLFLNAIHFAFPPAILGLVIFTLCLQLKIIKEQWIEFAANFLLKNMGILFVPFIVGLMAYKDILLKNWLVILLVIFITTSLTIAIVGLFVEYGLKILRLWRMRKAKNNE